MTEPNPANYAWWLSARAAGVVAFLLIATAVILGLFMATNISRRPGLKRILVKVHEQVAITALVAIAAHGVLMLGDAWLRPGVAGITIPFTLSYRPLWTGLGIIAGYLAAVLGPTFYLRKRIGPRRWRQIHRATFIVYLLALLHAFGSGTDGASLWFTGLAVVTAVPIAVLLAIRYVPRPAAMAKGPRRKPLAPSSTPVRP